MIPYSEFQPGPFDIVGLGLPDQKAWLVVPVMRTRDSEALARSNFDAALKMFSERGDEKADDDGYEDFETHGFNHWGPGWFDIIIVQPDSPAQKIAEEIEESLVNYPVLDECLFSEYEADELHDVVSEACRWLDSKHDVTLDEEAFDAMGVANHLNWDLHGTSPTEEAIAQALYELDMLKEDDDD